MKRELALEFARVTEAAALAAHKWVGRGKKESADQAGVDAMRTMLNRLAIDGEIVIGEGEIDEAPMLYIGEKVGLIYNEEEKDSVTYVDPVDIAVSFAGKLFAGESESLLSSSYTIPASVVFDTINLKSGFFARLKYPS